MRRGINNNNQKNKAGYKIPNNIRGDQRINEKVAMMSGKMGTDKSKKKRNLVKSAK